MNQRAELVKVTVLILTGACPKVQEAAQMGPLLRRLMKSVWKCTSRRKSLWIKASAQCKYKCVLEYISPLRKLLSICIEWMYII